MDMSIQAELSDVMSKVNAWSLARETDLLAVSAKHKSFLDTHHGAFLPPGDRSPRFSWRLGWASVAGAVGRPPACQHLEGTSSDAACVRLCFVRVLVRAWACPALTRASVYQSVGGLFAGWTDELKKKEKEASADFKTLTIGEIIPLRCQSGVREE